MARWAAFLRGMNVGGHRISNAELSAVFEGLGFSEVACFRASGNVVFDAEGTREQLGARIEAGLDDSLGYAVPTFLRTAAELSGVAEHQPFAAEELSASGGKLQVVFLLRAPAEATCAELLARSTADDRIALHGREIYWLPRGGILESGFDWNAAAGALGSTTMRTKNTINAMVAKYLD